MLAIAICAFQVMLDRGQEQDWFHSPEILIEAAVAGIAAWLFAVQLFTGRQPMFDRELFANRNLVTGLGFMLVTGVLMMASMALLPPMLQGLFGYSVFDAGLLLVPRGIGIVASMALAGRLIARGVDPRLMVAAGFAIAAASLWDMTRWTLVMSGGSFVVTGLVQGAGLGLVFIPLNLMAFATLGPQHRTEGASLLNLARNIGGSVGISIVTVLLARNVQTNHEVIGSHIPDLGIGAADPVLSSALGTTTDQLVSIADGLVNQQAAMIASLDDFKLMMILTLCAIPLVLLLKRPPRLAATGDEEPVHVAFD